MLSELELEQVIIQDTFWKSYLTNIKEATIPYQYSVMNDELDIIIEKERDDDVIPNEKSHALENFRIAAKISEGNHYGWLFQDSDVYKWLEAVAYSLINQPDQALESLADEVIQIIAKAQDPDGYLSTFYQIERPDLKFKKLYESHELYCAGHLIEAAIAYHQATGKDQLLTVGLKWCECIAHNFGEGPEQINGADGHQEIELALIRLYEYLGDERYLELASFFLEVRGKEPLFYQKQIEANLATGRADDQPKLNLTYLQAYTQPKKQMTAEGHAVRMLYMAAAMARLAKNQANPELLTACQAIWTNIYTKKMYVTGGVGSTFHGEAFTADYDLPNDTMYCETCASIALVYFAYELFKIEPRKEYMDVIERSLYNGIISGAAVDGTHFFYVNPLEITPSLSRHNPGQSHVKAERPAWLGCACCPPNFARTIGSLNRYIYTSDVEHKTLYVNLLMQSEASFEWDKQNVLIRQRTDFPKENSIQLEIVSNLTAITLKIRQPDWMYEPKINGQQVSAIEGYLVIKSDELKETTVTLTFETPILGIKANPLVVANTQRLAVQRGPFIYCTESVDNGENLHQYRLTLAQLAHGQLVWQKGLSTEVPSLKVRASIEKNQQNWQGMLYQTNVTKTFEECELLLIPYYLWANRGENELLVWQHEK